MSNNLYSVGNCILCVKQGLECSNFKTGITHTHTHRHGVALSKLDRFLWRSIKVICNKNKMVGNYSPWPRGCWQFYRQDLLGTEYDIQIFPPKNQYKSILQQNSSFTYPGLLLAQLCSHLKHILTSKNLFISRDLYSGIHHASMYLFHEKTLALECLKTFQTM